MTVAPVVRSLPRGELELAGRTSRAPALHRAATGRRGSSRSRQWTGARLRVIELRAGRTDRGRRRQPGYRQPAARGAGRRGRAALWSGCEPFIVPAMGSHGGATAAGQIEVLAGLGITAESVGAPIRATMDVVGLGALDGIPLCLDRLAAESDGIVLVNRVKPHTDFAGPIGSGLLKMLCIGLGNSQGADRLHREGVARDLGRSCARPVSPLLAAGAGPLRGGHPGEPAPPRLRGAADCQPAISSPRSSPCRRLPEGSSRVFPSTTSTFS